MPVLRSVRDIHLHGESDARCAEHSAAPGIVGDQEKQQITQNNFYFLLRGGVEGGLTRNLESASPRFCKNASD